MAIKHTDIAYVWKNTSTNEEFFSVKRDPSGTINDEHVGIYDEYHIFLGKPQYFITSVDEWEDAVFYNLQIDETPSTTIDTR